MFSVLKIKHHIVEMILAWSEKKRLKAPLKKWIKNL